MFNIAWLLDLPNVICSEIECCEMQCPTPEDSRFGSDMKAFPVVLLLKMPESQLLMIILKLNAALLARSAGVLAEVT